MRSRRLGGVPTTLPPSGARAPGQLSLGLETAPDAGDTDAHMTSVDPHATRPLPDVTHIRAWLTPAEQQGLAGQLPDWAEAPAGLRHPRVPTGHLMTVQSVCLGWH